MELWKETEQRMPRERRKQRTVEEINIDNQSGRSNKYIQIYSPAAGEDASYLSASIQEVL